MKYNWDKERLEETVSESNCWFDWLEKLGIPKSGCNYRTLKNKAKKYGIDTSHFNYEYARTHNGVRMLKNRNNEDIFSYGSRINKSNLKKEYIKRILNGEYKCECCGITEWNGKPIVLQIHHKDGDNKNNTVENLQLICPNCHSQTNNFSNKKRD